MSNQATTTGGGDDIIGQDFDVFLSYDHRHEERVYDDVAARLARALETRGYSVWWDRRLIADRWADQLLQKMRFARRVVTLETPRYFTRAWCLKEFEAGLRAQKLSRFVVEPCDTPAHLREAADAFQRIDAVDAGAQLGDLVARALPLPPSRPPTAERSPSAAVDLSALPSGGRLIGRKREMERLRAAWRSGSGVTAAALHAIGGAGKTAILHAFANEVVDAGGASRVYAWSASSQGQDEKRQTDADGFVDAALRFFGGDPTAEPGAAARAERLAERVQSERALLILDGLEPLQSVSDGRLTSRPLAILIKRLFERNAGLLLLSSRQPFVEAPRPSSRVLDIALDALDEEDAVLLLKSLGAHGPRRAFEAAARAVGRHALSVTMLGAYVRDVGAGDIHRVEDLNFSALEALAALNPDDPTARAAARAERIAESYLQRLRASEPGAVAEALPPLLGLFDRPADGAAVRALLAGPPIAGLTDALFQALRLGADGVAPDAPTPRAVEIALKAAKSRLRAAGLLLGQDAADPMGFDAHPIIRAYFRKRLRGDGALWRSANERLYRHYAASAPDQPDTLKAMRPLFHAVAHGVAAGRAPEAFQEVYYRRIRRPGQASFIATALGAYDADLAALAAFFESPWTTPHRALRADVQEVALNYAAFALRAVGRLGDAVAPFRASVLSAQARRAWADAAVNAVNLCETELALGRVAAATDAAQAAIADADRSGDLVQRMAAQAARAEALHQAGRLAEATEGFAAAEALQARFQPEAPQLYSLWGYLYADLLLASGAAAAAKSRAVWIDKLYDEHGHHALLDRALNTLLAARADAAQLRAVAAAAPRRGFWTRLFGGPAVAGDGAKLDAVERAFDVALERLTQAASDNHMPRGQIARAAFRRWRAEMGHRRGDARSFAELAAQDLDDAAEIADFSGMRLFQADIALERALLALRVARDRPRALAERAAARALIKDCGYARRQPELDALDAALGVR